MEGVGALRSVDANHLGAFRRIPVACRVASISRARPVAAASWPPSPTSLEEHGDDEYGHEEADAISCT